MDENIINMLKRISLFEEIKNDNESLEILSKIFTSRTYRAGETIIKEGDLGSEMFIVASGEVEIQKRTRAGDNYTVIKLKAAHNVFFGEMALIDDDKRSATVTAMEDSEFLVVDKKGFLKMGNDHPQIGLPITRAISKILAGRLDRKSVV